MSLCSRSRRRRLTVLNFKSWAYDRIYGHFSNMCTAHAQQRLFMFFRCKFIQRRSIPRPRYPVRKQNFGDLATFSVDFCVLYDECRPYLYFRFVSPTGLESIPHASTPTSIIPTKVEAPTSIRSWVMSDNVSHWLPLIMRTRPLRMRRITWPVSRGSKTITFWNLRPWFAYSLCTFGGSTINVIKVICKNNVRPCVKRRMSFCACAKSRDLLKVP